MYQQQDPHYGLSARREVGMAITALSLGVAAFLCLGPLLAVPAVICGIVALGRVGRDPETYGGRSLALGGIVAAFLASILWIGGAFYTFTVAVPQAARAAGRVQDVKNVTAITQAVRQHFNTFGRYPRDLGESYQFCPDPQIYVALRTPTEPMVRNIEMRTANLGNELARHCDYSYIGADLPPRNMVVHSEVILVYANDTQVGGRTVGFVDGRVEFASGARLEELFENSNHYRQALGLPEVRLDGPPPMPRTGQITQTPGVVPSQPVRITTPPPVPLHLTFSSVADALTYLRSARPEERNAAHQYMDRTTLTPQERRQYAAHLEQLFAVDDFRARALEGLKKHGTAENAPGLRNWLQATGSTVYPGTSNLQSGTIDLLVTWKDKESAAIFAQWLRSSTQSAKAVSALIALGQDAEQPILPLVTDTTSQVARNTMQVLTQVGTEKCLEPLHRALHHRDAAIRLTAAETLRTVAARLHLTPEQYYFLLMDRYRIDAPAGFVADSLTEFNVKGWTRTAPGRAVKSQLTITVGMVDGNFRINAPANAPRVESGAITFIQIASSTTNFQRSVRYQAVDGLYLLDITAVVDLYDSLAQTNMNNTVKGIRAREPSPAPR